MIRGFGFAVLIGLGLIMETVHVCAQTSDTSRLTVQGPILGNHLYSPITPLALPLIRTNTQMNLGAGQTTGIRLPVVTIGENLVVAPVGNLLVAVGVIRHEQAIKDWMSVYLEFSGVGRLGTNVSSLLAQGVNTSLSYQLGWKIRVFENENLSFSAGLNLRDGMYSTVDLQRWASGIADSGKVTEGNHLVEVKPAQAVSIPLKGLWTISDVVGIYGGVEAGYTEPIAGDANPTLVTASYMVVSANWNPVIDIPVGTSLGVGYSEIPEPGETTTGTTKNVYFRIGYTGESAFALGAQAVLQFAPIAGVTDEVTFITAGVDIRFYY